MFVFQHINTKVKLALNFKVMWRFFVTNEQFSHIQTDCKNVHVKYLLIRHPFARFLSFYKNKLFDFFGFQFLEQELKDELGKIYNISTHKFYGNKNIFRNRDSFKLLVDNLDTLYKLDPHINLQSNSLNYVNPDILIKIETDLDILKQDFKDLDLNTKVNESNSERLINFLNEETKLKLYEIYKQDFILGNYNTTGY